MKEILAKMLPPMVQALVANGIPVSIEDEGFMISGFYKHDKVLLYPVEAPERGNHEWEIMDRYGMIHPIHMFDDIVSLNFDLLKASDEPGIWGPILVEKGYMTVRTETLTIYTRK